MPSDPTYDVFLSHATADKPAVEELARRLKRRKLRPFLDKWHLVPGEPWQEALEEALDQSQTFAIFLGPGGVGSWQNEEMRDALGTRVRDKSRRVIPVLLPGASKPAEKTLPRFLRRLTWVDFHRSGLDDPDAFHHLVCGIKGVPPGDGRAASASQPTMIGVPHRNPYFTGREDLLARLHQQLQKKGITALAQAAIHGLGGIGKTQTAIEYAYRFGEHYRFVLWVVAEEETAIRSAYLAIARELKLIEPQADLETAVLAVKAWLAREDGWLLVFDNADDPGLVRPYLPATRTGGKVLLTSRGKSFTKVGIREPFKVETLEPEDAVKFLIERTSNADAQGAAELATELGYLPLALEQAAAYIETVGGSFAEYLARFRRQGVALFAKSKPSTDYLRTVATTWSLSFDAVREVSVASAELLTAAAFLVPDSTPIEIFTRGGSKMGNVLAQALRGADEDPLVFWELLEPLERHSLVERLQDNAFKLHRLTQEVIKGSLIEEDRQSWAERVLSALNEVYPSPEFENWKSCERLQSIVSWAFELTHAYKLRYAEAGWLFNKAGVFAQYLGDLANARLLQERSLEIIERVQGGEHPDTLSARNNLAVTIRVIGDFTGARKLHEQNLEIRSRVLGGEHPDTLESRNNLAATLWALDDLVGARKLHEHTLEVRARVLGSEHPSTLASMMWIGQLLKDEGRSEDAIEAYRTVMDIQRRVLGDEHPATTISTWNLFLIIRDLSDFDAEAEIVDRLRWLLDRDEDSIPSAAQREIRRQMIDLIHPDLYVQGDRQD